MPMSKQTAHSRQWNSQPVWITRPVRDSEYSNHHEFRRVTRHHAGSMVRRSQTDWQYYRDRDRPWLNLENL